MVKELQKLPVTANADDWTDDQRALMEAAGAYTRQEGQLVLAPKSHIMAFLHQAERSGLDPIARQIYLICRGGKWGIQGAIDGFRVVASRNPLYDNQETDWCGDDGVWRDVWPDLFADDGKTRIQPTAARVKVYKKGSDRPTTGIAKWSEFAVTGRGGENWTKMPSHMLAKVAEALALRKAFPQDFSGIYTAEEMGNDEAIDGTFTSREWKADIQASPSVDELVILMQELTASGEWTKALDVEGRTRRAVLIEQGKLHPEIVVAPEDQEDSDVGSSEPTAAAE